MTNQEIFDKIRIYNIYLGQLITLYRLKKLKEEIDQNKSISSR